MSSIPEKIDIVPQEDQNEVVAVVVTVPDDDMDSSVRKDADTISSSSSIGLISDEDGGNDEDGEEAHSKDVIDEGSLNSLATLEAALPFKRGLSDFYDGKSKAFMNLAEVNSVKEVKKEENPLNKRRRLIMAQTTLYKWGSNNSSSMPHLTLTDGEKSHSVGIKQESTSSTSSSSFSSANSATKPSIN